MARKKKSLKKNAFSFFLEFYVEQEKLKGRHTSVRNAAEEAGFKWQCLPVEQKKRFYDLAQSERIQASAPITKRDLYGEDIVESSLESSPEINSLIKKIDTKEALKNYPFYLVHCNYYCRTDRDVYFPAELAISEFTLQDGVRKAYHTIIDPGPLPLGYGYEAMKNSDAVHGIPLPPHENGEKNFAQILSGVENFIKDGKSEDDIPALFTTEQNLQAATDIFRRLRSYKYGEDREFRVYPLHRMFFWLKNKCASYDNGSGFPVLTVALMEIERDVYQYCSGISCNFHDNLEDKYQNCSLSIVQRLAYVICDHCCRHLQIKLVKGRHVHAKSKSKTVKNDDNCLSNERASSCASSVIRDDISEVSSYVSISDLDD